MYRLKLDIIDMFKDGKKLRFMYMGIYLICKYGLVKNYKRVYAYNDDTEMFEEVNLRKILNSILFPMIVSDTDVNKVLKYLTPIDNITSYNGFKEHGEMIDEFESYEDFIEKIDTVKSELNEFIEFKSLLIEKYTK